jgi:hypothetical protein
VICALLKFRTPEKTVSGEAVKAENEPVRPQKTKVYASLARKVTDIESHRIKRRRLSRESEPNKKHRVRWSSSRSNT